MRLINKNHLDRICGLTARRDQHARSLGMAYVEFELVKAKLLAEKPLDMMLQLGAACAEFDGFRNLYMGKVAADKKMQETVAMAALREAGIDPDDKTRTHTIDLATGAIKVLIGDQWRDIEEQAA